jgi:hypothetical protein
MPYKQKADGSIGSVPVPVERLRLLDHAEALALPSATPTKVFAEFRLLQFNVPNANGDAFRPEDITDDIVAAFAGGTPVYLDDDLDEHPDQKGRATTRARFQGGSVVAAEKREDGLYGIGAFQREVLEDRGIKAALLTNYSVSMEVIFDRTKAFYLKGTETYDYGTALDKGIASPVGTPDDRTKYDARYLPPMEFHALALLTRGRNADKSADVLRAAASQQEGLMENLIAWAEADAAHYEAFMARVVDEATAAELTSKVRKGLKKSQFAYVDEDGEGHLPIHDAMHVKNALARLNQTDISESAKRSALKKIRKAAKRFGVEVDKKSDVVKQYGDMHDDSMEEHMSAIRDAFYKKFSQNSPDVYPYIVKTYDDYIVAEVGDKTYRVDYKQADDGVEFGDKVEVEVRYVPVKDKEKAAVEETPKGKIDAPVVVAPQADTLTPEKRLEIEQAAVEAYKAKEKQAADRVKELGEILPVADDEREVVEKTAREADDKAYADYKIERLKRALEAIRKDKATATKGDEIPITLSGGKQPNTAPANPFYVAPPQ